jgi:hypothetical protein
MEARDFAMDIRGFAMRTIVASLLLSFVLLAPSLAEAHGYHHGGYRHHGYHHSYHRHYGHHHHYRHYSGHHHYRHYGYR